MEKYRAGMPLDAPRPGFIKRVRNELAMPALGQIIRQLPAEYDWSDGGLRIQVSREDRITRVVDFWRSGTPLSESVGVRVEAVPYHDGTLASLDAYRLEYPYGHPEFAQGQYYGSAEGLPQTLGLATVVKDLRIAQAFMADHPLSLR
jgi:hypothetical protein